MKQIFFGAALSLCALGQVHGADADADVTITTQGNVKLTLADIDGFMQGVPEERRSGFLSDIKRIEQLVTTTLREKQLAEQALSLKLDQDQSVKNRIAFATRQILAAKRVEVYEKSLPIPPLDVEAKEQYTINKSKYMTPVDVEVQHVLIGNEGKIDLEVKALAEKVRAEAVANPAAFDQLVQKYSDDPSKKENKGILHDATTEKYVAPFVAAAKGLTKENEIAPLVQTAFGYHIVRLVKIHPARQQTFAEVKDNIEAKLKDDYVTERRRALLSSLDKEEPTANPDLVEILRKRYAPANAPATGTAAAPKQ